MENNKAILKILVISVLLLAGFGYAAYFLFGKISSAGDIYTAKSAEFVSIEKKQEQIDRIKEELVNTKKSRNEIISSLLAATDVLDFIVKVEGIARAAGLAYEVQISKELTQESIDQELLALRRSKRRGTDADEAVIKEKLPGIVFDIDISGSYSGVIRFLEGVASFPYYLHIESISISKVREQDDDEATITRVQATIKLMVFTRK